MEVVVFGAGSLGSLIGGLLAREHDVVLVGRDPHVRTVRERGLRVTGEYDRRVTPRATTDGTDLEADLAVVTVKSFDTSAAARALATGTFDAVLSLQNGLGNEERLAATLETSVLAGTTTYGAVLREPGRVECTGTGEVAIGPPEGGESPPAKRVREAFSAAGIRSTVDPEMPRRRWRKLAVNAAINPVTALAGVANAAVLEDPARSIARSAARETARVAREQGIDLPDDRAVAAVGSVARATAENTSSMAQDVEGGRRTEIDAINGAVVERGGEPVPVNATLAGLVKTWERGRGLR